MKQSLSILIFFLISLTSFSQGLEKYKDIIDIDDEYEIVKSNLDELSLIDLSDFWINNTTERRFGFIGENHRRLRIKFLSLIKDGENSNQYFIYGKSKVSENICEFQGLIEIKESYYLKTLEYPDGKTGILAGEYTFYENSKTKHSGIFRGYFVTYWYKDKDGKIKYNDLWDVSSMYNNNQFVGIWTKYDKSNKMTANWGDSRIPQSRDLDVGTSEFGINRKYQSNGWDSFIKSWSGGFNKEETEKARNIENEIWWKEK